ncbi:MAG: hypothetical protein KKB91_01770 [Proteobacteria bacterium]|jgi:hypothetical protein|nr:hypothetical protein [Desulfocapsa sp.]MBU3944131.1 hypothetical protein [Pseudomonadota bacterium]MCG2743941.1 hypothetical protein [Desulfobacteraceae bacterium]MBU3982598.1 hypothetical protein [Pseudomonadota bacterium]MBU4029728.1 hypothetical protein [Pseudomonadota bacterium]
MNNKLQSLIETIKKLEQELAQEIQKKQAEYSYKIQGKKIRFDKEIKRQHKLFATRISLYLKEAELLNILTIPFIWSCLFPALFLDLLVSLFQAVCFPIYKIPKVKRSRYIVIDRHALSYLNGIEKLNCIYCGYFNGLIAYIHEIAGRTEQYWCPIKHARRTSGFHSRYSKFLEYGDAEGYRHELDKVRQAFEDLQTSEEDERQTGNEEGI